MMAENVLICMNPGDGETSYAKNSRAARKGISQARPILEDTIKGMFIGAANPTCFKLASLGCSSGPNALLGISQIMDAIYEICQERSCKTPEIQVFLNDLPANDFNDVFKSLPSFYEKLREEKGDLFGPCFISGTPGSFYGRLFPSKSLNFFYSSYGVHWISKAPQNISNNKGNIYIAKSSPPDVLKAYLEQFQKDFFMFLRSRSEELVLGGRMVLLVVGRSIEDPTSKDCCLLWELLAKSLLDMAAEGLVEEADIDNFNMPIYTPSEEEVRAIVEKEGSFCIDKLQIFCFDWNSNDDVDNKIFVFDKHKSGSIVANNVRAVTEHVMAAHFGGNVIDKLFRRYSEHVGKHLSVEKAKHISIVLAMTKKY